MQATHKISVRSYPPFVNRLQQCQLTISYCRTLTIRIGAWIFKVTPTLVSAVLSKMISQNLKHKYTSSCVALHHVGLIAHT